MKVLPRAQRGTTSQPLGDLRHFVIFADVAVDAVAVAVAVAAAVAVAGADAKPTLD